MDAVEDAGYALSETFVDPAVESIIVEWFLNLMELVRLYSCLTGDESDITLIARFCNLNVDFFALA